VVEGTRKNPTFTEKGRKQEGGKVVKVVVSIGRPGMKKRRGIQRENKTQPRWVANTFLRGDKTDPG